MLEPLLDQLKGSDRVLADVCDELGLPYSLNFIYRGSSGTELNLITTEELDVTDALPTHEASSRDYLSHAIHGLTIDEVEVVAFVGQPCKPDAVDIFQEEEFLGPFYRDPLTQVLEITPMRSSVDIKSPTMTYNYGEDSEAELEYFYGTACVLVEL